MIFQLIVQRIDWYFNSILLIMIMKLISFYHIQIPKIMY